MKEPRNRWEILSALIEINRYKTIAEVGASRGDMARGIIRTLGANNYKLDVYFLIDLPDHLKTNEGYYFFPEILEDRVEIQRIQEPSLEAVKMFKDGSLDLVFVDGDHSEQAFVPDIEAWWKKLRVGGILCGDDYLAPKSHTCHYRTVILDKLFKDLSSHPESRPSEGAMNHVWWVKKGIIYET